MPSDFPELDLGQASAPEGDPAGAAPASGLRKGAQLELDDDGDAGLVLALESKPPPPRAPQQAGGGHVLDDDDDESGLASLQLATEGSQPPPSSHVLGGQAPGGQAPGAGIPAVLRGIEPSPPSSRAGSPAAGPASSRALRPAALVDLPPSDAELEEERLRAAREEAEVRAVARYPVAPAAWWEAPLYAIRVLQRRRELTRELPAVRSRVDQAHLALGEAFVTLVDGARRSVGQDHPFVEMAAPLARFDQMAAESGQALAAANAALHEQIGAIDRELALIEAEVTRLDRDIEAADRERQRHAELTARSEAKVKRAEIELRAANDAARAAAGPDAKFAPPEHARRIRDLTAEKQARDAEHAPVHAAFQAADAALRQLQETQRGLRRKMSPLMDQRRAAQRAGTAQVQARVRGSEAVERERRAAYTEIGKLMLESRRNELSEADRSAVEAARRALVASQDALATHERALSAADPATFRRGLTVLGVAAGTVLLLVALVFAL